MPVIIKPISANLIKDADGFGKAVPILLMLGPLRQTIAWTIKSENDDM